MRLSVLPARKRLIKYILGVLAVIILPLPLIHSTTAYNAQGEELVKLQDKVQVDTPQALIAYYGAEYGLSATEIAQAIEITRCESGFVESAVGDGGNSFGLVQIHLPSHPEITKEQALDKYFATWFIVSEIKNGNMWKWTCGRILGFV